MADPAADVSANVLLLGLDLEELGRLPEHRNALKLHAVAGDLELIVAAGAEVVLLELRLVPSVSCY